jgi:hypothetical protein
LAISAYLAYFAFYSSSLLRIAVAAFDFASLASLDHLSAVFLAEAVFASCFFNAALAASESILVCLISFLRASTAALAASWSALDLSRAF